MFVVSADTYLESYGCEYHIFYIGKSKEECKDFIKNYNKSAEEFEEFCYEKNLQENYAEDLSESDKKIFDNYASKLIYDSYSFEVFKFNESKFDFYIDEFENGKKPLYIGGYRE